VAANEPLARDPILRIEAGTHTTPILRVVVNKDERIMETVSLDKTVRIWAVKDGEGLRIYNTHNFSVKMDDTDFDSDSVWAQFAPGGRLLVAGLDGYLRLYDKTFKNNIKKKAPGGKWIVAARFSPDGKVIAVGYADSPRVDIVSAETLNYIKKANTRDIKKGILPGSLGRRTASTFMLAVVTIRAVGTQSFVGQRSRCAGTWNIPLLRTPSCKSYR
jgi:WD40 repeat protein